MTINPTNLNETISKSKPNIQQNTIKAYETNLIKLKKMFESETYDFLNNVEEVVEKLKDIKYLSRRNIYNAIIVLLFALNSDERYDELLVSYREIRDKLNEDYVEEQKSGIVSDKQAPNRTTTNEIMGMLKEMEKELKPIRKKEEMSKKDFSLLQAYTLFSIYARMPMRNDVAGMKIIKTREFNKLSKEEREQNNYLLIKKNELKFILNDYKTNKTYKELELDILDKPLKRIIKYYLSKNVGGEYLFTTSSGKPITRVELSKLLIKYSQKYLKKSISTVMLRKAYLYKYAAVKKEMENDSKILGHDVKNVGLAVYVKESQEK